MSRKIFAAVITYFGLVFAVDLLFGLLRSYFFSGHANRYAFILFGPAITLRTHSGAYLFILQSAFFIPMFVVAATMRQLRLMVICIIVVIWGIIGWSTAVGFLDNF